MERKAVAAALAAKATSATQDQETAPDGITPTLGLGVLLIHRNRFMQYALQRLLLDSDTQVQVVATDGPERAADLLRRHQPDVLILGVAADAAELAMLPPLEQFPRTRLLVLIARDATSAVEQALQAGARGVLHCCQPPELLPAAVVAVHRGEWWVERQLFGRVLQQFTRLDARPAIADPAATLTAGERRVVDAVASLAGSSTRQLAQHLKLSEHTVRNHLSSVYAKLGLSNRVELYAYAQRKGWTRTRG